MTPNQEVKVLIVDDSASMRKLIRFSLKDHPSIKVVAEAEDARAARDAVNLHKPDVMTLDVEMPEMSGLEFLTRLMRARPMPVVMVSSLTQHGSEVAVKALSLGAVECIAKPSNMDTEDIFPNLGNVLVMAAQAQLLRVERGKPNPKRQDNKPYEWNGKTVLIGASTGGVEALEILLSGYPENCPPTLITQHMPEQFLENFAQRLNRLCAPNIRLAKDGEKIRQGEVLIAPGGATHLSLNEKNSDYTSLLFGPKRTGHRPSVDVLFASAVRNAKNCIAVILTGMGSDGAEGMLQLKQAGAFCIAQNKESAVVYGMPRVAIEKGAADISVHLSDIAENILKVTAVMTPKIGECNEV